VLRPGARRSADLESAVRGIDKCRRGEWAEGLGLLAEAVSSPLRGSIPGLTYSYLGYGIAHREGRLQEGLTLCRHALKLEIFEPDNYVNLARTQLLARDRAAAVRTVREGLRVDRLNEDLLALKATLGVRRGPMLKFLPRKHPLNRALGRLRHGWLKAFR